jgi:hypothetical protein
MYVPWIIVCSGTPNHPKDKHGHAMMIMIQNIEAFEDEDSDAGRWMQGRTGEVLQSSYLSLVRFTNLTVESVLPLNDSKSEKLNLISGSGA